MKSNHHKKLLHDLTAKRKALAEKQGTQRMLASEIQAIAAAIFDLEEELKKETQRALTVSEHAMLRYFERVEGYNAEHVAKLILPDDVREQVEKLGDGIYPVPAKGDEEFRIVVRARTVVTVETQEIKNV